MGRKCGVKGCLSDSQRTEDLGVTFHKVPFHSDIRPKWLQLCQIIEEKKVIYVCSRHFLRADFCNFKGKKYMLRQGVLPSIFSWNKPKQRPTTSPVPPLEETIVKTEPENDYEYKTENINDIIEGRITQLLHIKTEALDIKDEILSPSHSTTIEQKIKTVNTSTGSLTFVPNKRIEALDFNQTWQPATVLEVDYEENEVLVHFDMYSSKYDEWIGVNSNSIRALSCVEEIKKPVDEYKEGERCMASWSDARKFPATVTKVFENNTYEVLFDDGYVKTLKSHRMSKCSSTSPQCSPLFQPVSGTKEERRKKKRKLNVSSLFTRKRSRAGSQESVTGDETLAEVAPSGGSLDAKVDLDEPWYPSWLNNRPVGVDSYVFMSDGYRKSVIIPDPRLPPVWERHLVQRVYGTSAGKWETIIITPEGKKLRGRADVKQFIEENPELNLSESMFDFTITNKKKMTKRPQQQQQQQQQDEVLRPLPPVDPPNVLKIINLDGGFKCPIAGCGKNFRRENLAQMHVKHYHPEHAKFLDSTPNVADLAYARTVGESLDRSPVVDKTVRDVRVTRPRVLTPKVVVPKLTSDLPIVEPQSFSKAPIEHKKDAEIIKLLNSKPFDAIKSMDSSSVEPLPSGLPPSMYPDIKLKDLLVKSEAVPKNTDLNLKTLSSATTRPTGLKTLLPVKKDVDAEVKQTPVRPAGLRREVKRKRFVSELIDSQKFKNTINQESFLPIPVPEPVKVEAPAEPSDIIIEGGEVIKIVRMKQEEIINCTCGITEEDGLMIQCELCLCWQHAYCNNIYRENEVPEKYVCYICQHPARQRISKKYMHDQDWLKHGTLPTASYHCKDDEVQAKKFEKLKTSHDLSGGLHEMKDFMHSLKMKIKIAEAKNHPKLYLWSKLWDKTPLPEKQEVKSEQNTKDSTYSNKQDDSHNDSMLMSILKSGKEEAKLKEMSEYPKIDIRSLIENNLDAITSNIPQPEAAIDSADCRLNLLDHIAHCQNLVEERLGDFEKQINELDSPLISDNDENYTRVRQTTSMLLRDLNALKELSQITTF